VIVSPPQTMKLIGMVMESPWISAQSPE